MNKQTWVKLLAMIWVVQCCAPMCLGQRDCTDVGCPALDNCIEEVLEKGACCVSCVQRGCRCEGYQYYDCISAGFRNGKVPEGESYLVDFGSTECLCPTGGGKIRCHFIPCPDIPPNCIDLAEPTDGCAHCLRVGCVYRSQKYEAGHSFHMDPCQVCYCPNDGGDLMCSINPECKSKMIKGSVLPADSKKNENELHVTKHKSPADPHSRHQRIFPSNSLPLYTENTSDLDENKDYEYLPEATAMSSTEGPIHSSAFVIPVKTSPEPQSPLLDQYANSGKNLRESLDTFIAEFREEDDMNSPRPMVPTNTPIREGQKVILERALVSESPTSHPETTEGPSHEHMQTEGAGLLRDGPRSARGDEKPTNVSYPHRESKSPSHTGMRKNEKATEVKLHTTSTGYNNVTKLQLNSTNTPPVNRKEHESHRQPKMVVSNQEEIKEDVKDLSPKTVDHGVSPWQILKVCCEAGENWASAHNHCNNMTSAMMDSHSVCWTAQIQCCLGSLRESRCVAGLTAAKQGQACGDDSAALCGTDSYKECCSCCALGLRLHVEQQKCEVLQGLGFPCSHVLLTCCLGVARDSWSTVRERPQPQPTSPPKRVSDSDDRHPFSLGGAEEPENLVEEVKGLEDVDECEVYATQLCSQRCINTPGSYTCACFHGYILQPDRSSCLQVMVDEENRLTENEVPTASPAELPTPAPPSLQDPCEGNGVCAQQCSPVDGRPVCSCFPGFSLLADGRSCEDINECLLSPHTCQEGERCINTVGHYTCEQQIVCPAGYQVRNNMCEDVDECRTVSQPCTAGFSCINTVGSYSCQRRTIMCGRGYHASPDGMRCTDVDECQARVHRCGEDQLCHNLPGTYRCDCHTGYQHDMFRRMCVDVNECWKYPGRLCAQTCENTPGSYRCSCSSGFSLSTDGKNCEDVNECLDSPCSQECANIHSSFQCYCKQGYQLQQDGHTCEDIDECSQRIGNLCAFKCVNVPGSYQCACPEHGYTLSPNGRSCQDVDECGTAGHNCTAGETCYNIQGGYRCLSFSCPYNYHKVSDTRCERLSCSNFVECQNTPLRITYYQLSFQTNIIIPAQIFRIGPSPAYSGDIVVVSISKGNEEGYFSARKLNAYTGAIHLHRQVQQPRDFILDVEMKLWRQGTFTTFLAKIYIFITANML